MARAVPLDSTKPFPREVLPPAAFAARERPIADRTVGIGGFIALPILRTVESEPIDLIEFAADRSVVLVFCRGDRCSHSATTLWACAEMLPRIEAAGGALIAVTSEGPGRAFGTARGNGSAVVVDKGDRFAQTLGLVAASSQARHPPHRDVGFRRLSHDGHERPMPATYVLAPCGRVTWAHVDVARLADPDDVVAALERLAAGPADRGRTASSHAWQSIL